MSKLVFYKNKPYFWNEDRTIGSWPNGMICHTTSHRQSMNKYTWSLHTRLLHVFRLWVHKSSIVLGLVNPRFITDAQVIMKRCRLSRLGSLGAPWTSWDPPPSPPPRTPLLLRWRRYRHRGRAPLDDGALDLLHRVPRLLSAGFFSRRSPLSTHARMQNKRSHVVKWTNYWNKNSNIEKEVNQLWYDEWRMPLLRPQWPLEKVIFCLGLTSEKDL